MLKYLFFFILINCFQSSYSVNEEFDLRKNLFTNYNRDVRPTKNYKDVLDVGLSVAVQNIESFDQIHETIDLNVWLRKYWKNHKLTWDKNTSNITQLTISKNDVWTPDIELVNAATLPDIYTLKGGMYLYPDGEMLWSMPSIYKTSCPLKLKYFPFDKQVCSLTFSSWSYDNSLLNLKPKGDANTQIDVLDTFSHSEWKLLGYSLEHYNETRTCCPNKLFSVIKYNFELERYTHYYTLNMGMTISLVIVSFIIMMIKPDNLSRTGTAVFIPLTILALQLTIAGKIPVVGYYTLMDIFFLTCFITSMMVSIESGIVYTLITAKSPFLYKVFNKILDFETLVEKYKTEQKNYKIRCRKHSEELSNLLESTDANKEFTETENILCESLTNRTESYKETVLNNQETNLESNIDDSDDSEDSSINLFESIVDKDVVRTIEYNNSDLSLTFKEYLVFQEIVNIAVKIDNILLILFPTIFFILMCIIFSYNN